MHGKMVIIEYLVERTWNCINEMIKNICKREKKKR
jgi:hypothetical protein